MSAINNSTSGRFAPWRPACWIHAHGPDAESFLQGQFTNDLRLLERQPAVYGLWLSVKGKVLADSFILRAEGRDSFWIGSYASPAGAIRARLESHIIADDVVLEDFTAGWAGRSLLGDVVEAPPAGRGILMFPGRRSRAPSVEWVGPTETIAEAGGRLAPLDEIDREGLERIRIADGIPAVPADVGPADLPHEGGLDADAISYTKGCYLGQEVMARLKSMGQVRRRLLRVRGRGEMPPARAPLFGGGRQVGELRSAARDGGDGFIAMAMLSLLHVNAASELSVGPDAAPTVRLIDSP